LKGNGLSERAQNSAAGKQEWRKTHAMPSIRLTEHSPIHESRIARRNSGSLQEKRLHDSSNSETKINFYTKLILPETPQER
jgi:hypothetical protein